GVDLASFLGRLAVSVECFQIAAARNDIERLAVWWKDGRRQLWNQTGLMLAVAIDGYENVIVMGAGILEGCTQGGPIAHIVRMHDYRDARLAGKHVRRVVAGAVVDDEHGLAVASHLGQHVGNVPRLVINGQRGQAPASDRGDRARRRRGGLATWRFARK